MITVWLSKRWASATFTRWFYRLFSDTKMTKLLFWSQKMALKTNWHIRWGVLLRSVQIDNNYQWLLKLSLINWCCWDLAITIQILRVSLKFFFYFNAKPPLNNPQSVMYSMKFKYKNRPRGACEELAVLIREQKKTFLLHLIMSC